MDTTVTTICHTPECGNAGARIEMPATVTDLDGTHEISGYACGACGQAITDVAPG